MLILYAINLISCIKIKCIASCVLLAIKITITITIYILFF